MYFTICVCVVVPAARVAAKRYKFYVYYTLIMRVYKQITFMAQSTRSNRHRHRHRHRQRQGHLFQQSVHTVYSQLMVELEFESLSPWCPWTRGELTSFSFPSTTHACALKLYGKGFLLAARSVLRVPSTLCYPVVPAAPARSIPFPFHSHLLAC